MALKSREVAPSRPNIQLSTVPCARPYPGWVMSALGGMPVTIVTAGKTVPGTFLELLTSPDVLDKARAEIASRVEADPMPALLPDEVAPPINLPWPDYRVIRGSGRRRW